MIDDDKVSFIVKRTGLPREVIVKVLEAEEEFYYMKLEEYMSYEEYVRKTTRHYFIKVLQSIVKTISDL